MEVAAQRGADLPARLGRRLGVAGELGEVLGCLARQRLGDDGCRARADAGEVGESPGVGEALQLVGGTSRIASAARRNACTFGRALRTRCSSSAMRSSASTGSIAAMRHGTADR